MAAKMFALFVLLALCASAATATYLPWQLPSVMTPSTMNPCMQYCMTQQPLVINPCMQNCMMQQSFTMDSLAMNPCMQYCMMQQSFTMGSLAMNPCMQYCMTQQPLAMNPCMQYCMKQQSFAMGSFAMNPCMQLCLTMGSFASPTSLVVQQPWALPLQQYWTQMVMPFQQCQCGAISQVMQRPFMFNPMATAIPPMFFQQPFVGVPF